MLTDTYLWISNHVLVHMFMSLQTMYVVCTPIHRQCFQQTIWRYSRCLLWSNEESDGNVWCLRPREREHNNISGFPYSRICLSLHLSTLLLKGCSGGKPSCIYNFSKICVLDQLPSQITLMWISVKFTPLFSFAVWETLLNTWEGSNIFVALLYKLLKIE